MQTVYTVALVLGLETTLATSYSLIFSPNSGSASRSTGYLLGIFLAILLLAIRFFWVPRNLNTYVASFYDKLGDRVFTRMTTFHFPIALAHALLFYYICHVFVDMSGNGFGIDSPEMTLLVTRFILLCAGLLLLNALWLWRITPDKPGRAGKIWAMNNFFFVAVAVIELVLLRAFDVYNSIVTVILTLTLICNSIIDLWRASKFYIVYED